MIAPEIGCAVAGALWGVAWMMAASHYRGKAESAKRDLDSVIKRYHLLDQSYRAEVNNWKFAREQIYELQSKVDQLGPKEPRVRT